MVKRKKKQKRRTKSLPSEHVGLANSLYAEDVRVLNEFMRAVRLVPLDVEDDVLLVAGRVVSGSHLHYVHWSVGQLRRVVSALQRRGVTLG